MPPPNKNNPYAKAAGAYDTHAQAHTPDQRELEARILLKANRMMQELLDNWENISAQQIEDALKYNRQIWMLFYDTALENKDGGRPNDLRNNIINLANFIFKREMEILADPQKQKFDVLLNINREISAGLMTQNAATEAKRREEQSSSSGGSAPPPSGSSTDISG